MGYEGLIRVVSEQRRFARVPYENKVHYTYGAGLEGTGVCEDVGLGGLRLRLGRYLRPGTLMMVRFGNELLELKGRVSWCRGAKQHHFMAGLRVFHDEIEAALALARVSTWAAIDSGQEARLWTTPYPKVVMG